MVSEFPQEISEALRKEKAACTTTALEVSAFSLGIATLFFLYCLYYTGIWRGKNKGGNEEAFRKDGRRVASKRICATSLEI